jgi:hypothetical protein
LKAGYRWLDVYCGGCRQVKPIDLAAVDDPESSALKIAAYESLWQTSTPL